MGKLIRSAMVSLDGFVAGPNGEIDWILVDEEIHTIINDQQRKIDTYLYGRRLYETMQYWETADQNTSSPAYELEFAEIWQNMPKVVFSTTLEQVQGNIRLVRDSAIEEIRKLKQQPGKIMEIGGSTLAATAIKLGLVDEYGLFVNPVVLGSGLPFFPDLESSLNLRLVETRPFQSGVVYLRYEPVDNSS